MQHPILTALEGLDADPVELAYEKLMAGAREALSVPKLPESDRELLLRTYVAASRRARQKPLGLARSRSSQLEIRGLPATS